MSAPRLLLVTDRTQARGPLPEVVAAAVAAGARAVWLRDRDLPLPERRALAAELRAALDPVGGLLVWGGAAGAPEGTAVHLTAADPFPAVRPPLVGRSCHSAAELARAAAEGCDWATLSPFAPTASKPGYGPALGTAGLAALAPGAPPVLALGGVRPGDVAGCLAAGASGVAVMGPAMRDPAVVAAYCAALAAA
ncbi:thiamine-phosphate pyrophosphorylase [Geodermatophilus dictyosporus]|uniref:Thiamine-phosphate pyrophosphorylase n=1 Tax=Geodermatophilus dictyosporus TaxID=1523247 RepID=A0A1I5SF25_9ACTN|nr:thiamine phosphate synthase [Geodermatophilus dictyosporus]SFP69329.1 thiamine-phosphate pyrophosphorylase [Geodermatophilus dictyosporus]